MLKIAVPFPPGGSMDTIARLLGEQINKAYDPTVVIENCPGGGAAIASTTKVIFGTAHTHWRRRHLPLDQVRRAGANRCIVGACVGPQQVAD